MSNLKLAILMAGLAIASSATASITVTIDSVNPGGIVTLDVKDTGSGTANFDGGVYAGVYNLTVNGVATPSFCIDVAHDVYFGETFHDYSYATLSDAPDTPAGPMGSAHAAVIEKLWAAYYGEATTGPNKAFYAAALQLAIWESEGSASYGNNLGYTITASDYPGYSGITVEAGDMLANLPHLTAEAGLEALVSADGQSYVVAVPEPTTLIAGALLLLPFGASTLRILRRNRAA